MHPAIERGLAGWEPGPAFPTYPAFKQLTLDIAADIFMGGAEDHGPAEMDRVNRAFIDCVQAAGAIVRRDVPFTRWRRGHRGRGVLEDFLRHYLPSRRAERTDDLFSVLCHVESDDGERFSDDDVVNHMIFLMMAAHDTSTSTLTTMVRHLGQHPEWQERCRAEVEALPERPTLAELDALDRARPGDEGGAAAHRAGAGRRPADREGHRGRRRAHPARHLRAPWRSSTAT